MVKTKQILTSLAAVTLISGCAMTTHRNSTSAQLNLEMNAKLTPEIEVDMSKKITGSATLKKVLIFTTQEPETFADGVTYLPTSNSTGGGLFSMLTGGGSEDRVKSAAAYAALSSGKADFIVAPTYIVKSNKTLFTHDISVQVTGYAGKIKNIKPAAQ